MPSPLALPKTFATDDPSKLKEQLERMTHELDTYLREREATTVTVPLVAKPNSGSVSFGQALPVSARDGETVIVKLPLPDTKSIGKRCAVFRTSSTGEILVYATDCQVGGAERYRMANDIHAVEFLFLGDYYPTRFGGGS